MFNTCSSLGDHIMCVCDELHIGTFRFLHRREPLPKKKPLIIGLHFCYVSLPSHELYIYSFLSRSSWHWKTEISSHNSLIHVALTWKMPQKQVGLPVAVPQRRIQDMEYISWLNRHFSPVCIMSLHHSLCILAYKTSSHR